MSTMLVRAVGLCCSFLSDRAVCVGSGARPAAAPDGLEGGCFDSLQAGWRHQVGGGGVGVVGDKFADALGGLVGAEQPAEPLQEPGFAQAGLGGVGLGVDSS